MSRPTAPELALPSLETLVGLAAAFCTTFANLPQAIKAWRTQSTGDLSLRMVGLLCAGTALWIAYGALKGDTVIMLANAVSLALLLYLLACKLRGR